MNIKICGITKKEETAYLNKNKVDYAGFVFYEKSKRNLTIDKAKELFAYLDSDIKKVSVMVSPDVTMIKNVCEAGFDIIQIHKVITEEVLNEAKLPVWYAVNIASAEDIKKSEEMLNVLSPDALKKIEGIVVDAKNFGSGITFDWQTGKNLKDQYSSIFAGRKFILAGGLRPENVKEGIDIFEPDIVDVSSGVECESGKSEELIDRFVANAREE